MVKLKDIKLISGDDDKSSEFLKAQLAFNLTDAAFQVNATIDSLFDEQVNRFPDAIAVTDTVSSFTYKEISARVNQLAAMLTNHKVKQGDIIGLHLGNSVNAVVSMLAVLKTGAAYLPVDPAYPYDRIRYMIEDARIPFVITEKKYFSVISRLQWECDSLHTYFCIDSDHVNTEPEPQNELGDLQVWDYVGENTDDDISGGAWFSSYTGEKLGRNDMDEYADNIYLKLKPYLNSETRILEIGCSSGISMFKIAPHVAHYCGTDLSASILQYTESVVRKKGLTNISLHAMPAHDINLLKEQNFDIVIINSVIQCFNGYNYFKDVLEKALSFIKKDGLVFIGDVQDITKKAELISSITEFKNKYPDSNLKSKTEWSKELFFSPLFFRDLQVHLPQINNVAISDKIGTCKNELTLFRFDVLMEVRKVRKSSDNFTGPLTKVQLDARDLAKYPDLDFKGHATPESMAYIIYTSGSTGQPKGCMVTHRNVVRLMKNEKHNFDFSEKDVWIQAHSSSFDFSVWEIYGALLHGGKLVIPKRSDVIDVERFLEIVRENKVTVLNQTPLAFYNFIAIVLNESVNNLSEHLRYVVFGGDRLEPERLIKWIELYSPDKVQLINMYGITETTVHVTFCRLSKEDITHPKVKSPIGKPLPETKVFILDDHLQALPVGMAGEMFIGGSGVCMGYLGKPELTSQRFVKSNFSKNEKLYRSGDLAKWLPDGTLEILGRKDDQVKIRGHRIEPGEIEKCLLQRPEIKGCIVMADPVSEIAHLTAYIVSDEETDTKELKQHLSAKLPEYMIPAEFVRIDQLPLTANGKVDKKALLSLKQLPTQNNTYTPPRNHIESVIAEIWSDTLHVSQVSIGDNFFALGGDSIKAINVAVKIKEKLKIRIRISDLFANQTIDALVKVLPEFSYNDELENEINRGVAKIEMLKKSVLDSEEKDKLPASLEDIYPLTSIESGMIYSSLLRVEEPVYYDQFTYQIEIKDVSKFRKVLKLLIHRHPILRTVVFMSLFNEPLKVVLKDADVPLEEKDLSGLNVNDQKKNIEEYLDRERNSRYEFEGDVLWKMGLFNLGNDQYFLMWSFHHSILDGWSMGVFTAELTVLMSQELPDTKLLGEIHSSYKDYCAIVLGRQLSPVSVNFWKDLLEGYTRNKLPFNYSGKKLQTSNVNMEKVSAVIGTDVLTAMEKLAGRYRVSVKSIALSAHIYLMHILCAENEVITGIVSHDRPPIKDADKILGCFLNTIPVRINAAESKDKLSLIKTVHDYLSNVKLHELHLTDVSKIIGEKSSMANPIFDCLLNFTDFHVLSDISSQEEIQYSATSFDNDGILSQGSQMTNTLFDLEVDKTVGRFTARIKYHPSYFMKEDVAYALDLYVRILEDLCLNPDGIFDVSSLLKKEELEYLLKEFNDTVCDYSVNETLHSLFEKQVLLSPGSVALRFKHRELTYEELNVKSNQLSHYLLSKGVQQGDNIGLICRRGFDMIIGMYAILKCGAAYVPIDPLYPSDRQLYIVGNSDIKLVLTDDVYPSVVSGNLAHIEIKDSLYSDCKKTNPMFKVPGKNLAYTIYTSGSTGKPKGVMIPHHSAVNLVEWVNKEFNVGVNDRLLFITSMCFDLSVYDIFGILAAGGTLVIAEQDEINNITSLKNKLQEEAITFWDSVPTTLNYLVQELMENNQLYVQSSLRLIFLSGDWIPVALPDQGKIFFPNANWISLGGATEGTVWSNFYPIKSVSREWSSIPYGKPIDNNFFYILDDRGKPVPRGVMGELYIGGTGVALGYMNDVEKTTYSFKEDPFNTQLGGRMYRTGDLGRLMPDGNMEFLGRKDYQVKIRGYRVELGEIEHQLVKHDCVKEAIVDALKDQQNQNFLCAYIVANKNVSAEELRSHLKELLPAYMQPAYYVFIDKLPLNSNGKIDRKQLPKPDTESKKTNGFVAPVTETEKQLCELWEQLLGINSIGVHDNVLDLGAHSLIIGAFVNRAFRNFNLKIEIREVLDHPTIKELSKLIEGIGYAEYASIARVEEKEYY
ncbi:MAG: hypothetical protein K0S32_3262, partial [Bacteroidetes bacterium]|nr:hypothetical protein [Bacteroidota bacterium]